MPTYTNSGTDEIIITQPRVVVFPPDSTVETSFYIPILPDNLTLDSDEPLISPWKLLATVSTYPSDDVITQEYPYITIYNANSNVTVSANGDDDNAFEIVSGNQTILYNKSCIIGKLNMLDGNSDTYVWGSSIKIENLTQPTQPMPS